MKYLFLIFTFLTLSPFSLSANQLVNHPSPYLALHGNDPVDWVPWSEEALKTAKQEDKLLFISVGYFSCHWCHVMQRESFSDKNIAAKLNKRFVSVKVDREINPVLDQRLMTFLQSTTGRGGWPMNIILTPDGYPIVGITYLPPGQFDGLIDNLLSQWDKDREKLTAAAKEVDGLIANQLNSSQNIVANVKPQKLIDQFVSQSMSAADELLGGFGNRNKFPSAPQLQTLMAIISTQSSMQNHGQVSDFLKLTLDTMATSGLNDAVGDGFYRYTMDPNWQRPHFEKMLYTSAQLVPIYISAWERWGNELYKDTAVRTLDFMTREMQGRNGGLIASLSAVDDKNIEGGYYLWSKQELQKLLTPEEYQLSVSIWGVNLPSEYDEGSFPIWQVAVAKLASVLDLSETELTSRIVKIQEKLLDFRVKNRVLPRDDKMLASWNGLALAAYAAGVSLDKKYLKQGEQTASFISSLWNGKTLTKAMDNRGKEFGSGSLPDYAAAAYGLIQWGLATNDQKILKTGKEIIASAWSRFYSANGWLEKEHSLLPNPLFKQHITGGSEPSSESLLLKATQLAAAGKSSDKHMKELAEVLQKITFEVQDSPYYYAGLIEVYLDNL